MAKNKLPTEINLLPQEEFQASTLGRTLKWLLGTFRMIVISTEMIVMLAFLSRFWLDAQNNDLTDSINQERVIVGSYKSIEDEFRLTQAKLSIFSQFTSGPKISSITQKITSNLPPEVVLENILLKGNNLQIQAKAQSEKDAVQLIANLENTNSFQNIKLTRIEKKADETGIGFSLNTNVIIQNGN